MHHASELNFALEGHRTKTCIKRKVSLLLAAVGIFCISTRPFPTSLGTRYEYTDGHRGGGLDAKDARIRCDSKIQNKYARQEGSSAISLDVSNLKYPYNSSHGWLSQEGEDRWLYDHFFHAGIFSGPGTFLELGGLDGIKFSNTYIFEKALRWRGILIEASTINFASLERNRGQGTTALTLHAAVCEPGKTLRVYGSDAIADVTHKRNQQVSNAPCIDINDVLRNAEIEKLDFLSLDVEGMELAVLEQMNFQTTQTFVILVEMRPVDEATNPAIRKHLSKQGFCLFASDVGHANEVWINPYYEHASRTREDTDLTCEDFLGMPSALWLRKSPHAEYDGLPCEVHLGERPESHVRYMGTTCQPWMTKCSIQALLRIMRPTMHGLEWSCGSGTLWYVQRLESLTSIEHDSAYFQKCRESVLSLGADVAQKWSGYHVSVNKSASDRQAQFREYVNKPLQLDGSQQYDLIVVDGRERVACLDLVLKHGLLRPEDGVLVLDNSERQRYAPAIESVPSHWLRYDFKTSVDVTTIWITRLNH